MWYRGNGSSDLKQATKGRGRAAPPLPLSRCYPLLPTEPADQETAADQQCTSAEREERGGADTTRRGQRLGSGRRTRSGRRRWCRSSLRWRGRSGLGRLGLTRGLGHNPSCLGDYHAVLTLGLCRSTTGLGLLGLGVGHDRRPVLSQSGRSGQHGHRQHRRQHHQLPHLAYLPPRIRGFRGREFVSRKRRALLHKGLASYQKSYRSKSYRSATTSSVRLAASRRGLVDLLVASSRVRAAYVDRGANLLELEVVNLTRVLDEVDRVLGVAGVTDTLDVRTLVRVVARAGYIEGLI